MRHPYCVRGEERTGFGVRAAWLARNIRSASEGAITSPAVGDNACWFTIKFPVVGETLAGLP